MKENAADWTMNTLSARTVKTEVECKLQGLLKWKEFLEYFVISVLLLIILMVTLFFISGYIFIEMKAGWKYYITIDWCMGCVHPGESIDPDIKEASNFVAVLF